MDNVSELGSLVQQLVVFFGRIYHNAKGKLVFEDGAWCIVSNPKHGRDLYLA